MKSNKAVYWSLFVLCGVLTIGAENAWAQCSADDQATYHTCISDAADSCLDDLSECDATRLQATNSAALVRKVITKCCAKSSESAQLSCAAGQIVRLVVTRSVIPGNPYAAFRSTASAAIKELRELRKDRTLCDTGSN